MRVTRPLALVLSLLAAGCLAGPTGSSTLEAAGPPLAAYEACDFVYPDGSPIPCRNDAAPATVQGARPDAPWICQHRHDDRDQTFEIWWNPDTDRYGIWYAFKAFDEPTGGILTLEFDDGFELMEWTDARSRGFLLTPDRVDRGESVAFRLYRTALHTDTPALENATVQTLWTLHDDTPWLVWKVTAEGTSYHFHQMSTWDFRGTRFHFPSSLHAEGPDFNLTLEWATTGGAGFTFFLNAPQDCTLARDNPVAFQHHGLR